MKRIIRIKADSGYRKVSIIVKVEILDVLQKGVNDTVENFKENLIEMLHKGVQYLKFELPEIKDLSKVGEK